MNPVWLKVEEGSRTPEARSAAREMARTLGFDEAGAERAAIIATEACTNLLKHAGGGTLFLSANEDLQIELLTLDNGPGMANFRQSVQDGYSTTGTSGTGLGAISRLAAFYDAYSQDGRGTVLFALIANGQREKLPPPRICGLRTAKPGQDVCGDAWAVKRVRSRSILMVADGLGHGPGAAEASSAAVDIFNRVTQQSPKELLESIHRGLRHTRGAAISIAELDEERRTVHFAGVGNVAGLVCQRDGAQRQMVSMNGTSGMDNRTRLAEFSYPWPEGASVVLHSDGLSGRWQLSDYPALAAHGPALIAGVLFRDFSRGNDDSTIVVAV